MSERTPEEIYGAVLDVKGDVLEIKNTVLDVKRDLGDLREHVNHRSGHIEEELRVLRTGLDRKADKSELLTSVVFKALAKPAARWFTGIVGAAVLATAGREHWLPYIERLIP